jgi:hypothetical protein
MPSGALPDRAAASQSPRQAPAAPRGCPDANGALACIKPARTGGVDASGPSASMGPEPQPTGGSFLFYRHGTDTNIQSYYAKV